MDIRALVVSTLKDISVPVYWIKWSGDTEPPKEYITFQTLNRPNNYADDIYHTRKHYVYLDLFSETDPYSHKATINKAMEEAGFVEVDFRDIGRNNERYETCRFPHSVDMDV